MERPDPNRLFTSGKTVYQALRTYRNLVRMKGYQYFRIRRFFNQEPARSIRCARIDQLELERLGRTHRNRSDLIVIATHGLTGLKRFFLGSVTEKVVRRARCPVFTVRAFGESMV
jgi:hypothetical protein